MRILGQEHFPTDVLVGGAAGWPIGHYLVQKHPLHQVKKTVRGKAAIPSPEADTSSTPVVAVLY